MSQNVDLATQLAKVNALENSNREMEIRLGAELANIERELATVRQQAINLFGTADLNELRAQYQRVSQEDRAAVASFMEKVNVRNTALTGIANRLAAYRSAQAGA